MRLFNQRNDVSMGFMPSKLVAGPHQIAMSAPAAVRAKKCPARRVIAIIAFGTCRTRPAFLIPFDPDPSFGLILVLAVLVVSCAPASSPATETAPAPSSVPTQVETAAPTPTPFPSPTFTASPTVAVTATVVPTAAPTLTAVVPPVSQIVTGLSVCKNVTFTSCAHANPIEFTRTITTCDSATVEDDWLLRGGSVTYNSPPQKKVFQPAETKTVTGLPPYNAACGRYSLNLHAITPNYMISSIFFSVP